MKEDLSDNVYLNSLHNFIWKLVDWILMGFLFHFGWKLLDRAF